MAQRRMFSKKITETDSFLDMSMSAQCLYFHLNMSADDDGFIGNVKTIKRMIGASDDDLRLLFTKEFIIPFESGVVVIKDWKIHNYIQKDRYNETIYKDEKQRLLENKNKQYQLVDHMDTECIQNVSSSDTQVRLGKERVGKVRQEVGEEESSAPAAPNAFNFYQENIGMLNPITTESIGHWIDDIGEELVIEALRRTALDGKGFRWAEGIMRSWVKNNVKTIEDAQAEEAGFANNKRGANTNNQNDEGDNSYGGITF